MAQIEVRLTIHYSGLKATQYFSKTSPRTELLFLDDLQALKLPLPKRGNSLLLSFGRMECVWDSVQKNALLHKQIKTRLDPLPENRVSFQKLLDELSIANITARFCDLQNFRLEQLAFKRPGEEVEDHRPLKKTKFNHGFTDALASNDLGLPKQPKADRMSTAANEFLNHVVNSSTEKKFPNRTSASSRWDLQPTASGDSVQAKAIPPLNALLPPRPKSAVPDANEASATQSLAAPMSGGTRYSPHTLAVFAKDYSAKIEGVSSPLFDKLPPKPLPAESITKPTPSLGSLPARPPPPPPDDAHKAPREALRAWQAPLKAAVSKSTKDVQKWTKDPRADKPSPTAKDGGVWGIGTAEERLQRISSNSTLAKSLQSVLVETQTRLFKVEAELAQERRRRRAAEDAISDIRRECRAPFVVPSLLDAFMELSRLTTIATTTPMQSKLEKRPSHYKAPVDQLVQSSAYRGVRKLTGGHAPRRSLQSHDVLSSVTLPDNVSASKVGSGLPASNQSSLRAFGTDGKLASVQVQVKKEPELPLPPEAIERHADIVVFNESTRKYRYS